MALSILQGINKTITVVYACNSFQALLNALNNTNDSLEANSILTHISFLDWASLDLVVDLEMKILMLISQTSYF